MEKHDENYDPRQYPNGYVIVDDEGTETELKRVKRPNPILRAIGNVGLGLKKKLSTRKRMSESEKQECKMYLAGIGSSLSFLGALFAIGAPVVVPASLAGLSLAFGVDAVVRHSTREVNRNLIAESGAYEDSVGIIGVIKKLAQLGEESRPKELDIIDEPIKDNDRDN